MFAVCLGLIAACSSNEAKPRPLPGEGIGTEPGWFGVCEAQARIDAAPSAAIERLGVAPSPPIAPPLDDRVFPTNQWWTDWLIGARNPLWAIPLAVKLDSGRIELSNRPPHAASNAVITPFDPSLAVLVDAQTARVASWGDFHVVAELGATAATAPAARLTVAQGSPAVWVTPTSDTLRFALDDGSKVMTVGTDEQLTGTAGVRSRQVRIELLSGEVWDIATASDSVWLRRGNELGVTTERAGTTFGIVAKPEGASQQWDSLAYDTAINEVIATTAEWQISGEQLLQRLTWKRRRNGAGVIVAMPHHTIGARQLGEPVAGTYPSARGSLSPRLSDIVEWASTAAITIDVPKVDLLDSERSALATSLADEVDGLATFAERWSAGSYFGPKVLGRLATLVDIADRYGTAAQRDALRTVLATSVADWTDSSGDGDARWLGYDNVWGGMMSSSPEFGHDAYNDHHFQFGYLIQAAATLAEIDGQSATSIRPVIDLLIADIGTGNCHPGFPPLRVMNPYEGHSYAGGLPNFTDGNNQESSSEAVHAWWAIARWAQATGQQQLATRAHAFFATEAATARAYWLGENLARPVGYEHQVAGIVWGGKVDFATFFDPLPASVIGIQLLPFTFGSLYRSDSGAAAERYAAGSAGSGDRWQDLLALDLAIADPARAMEIIEGLSVFEEGNSKSFAIAWIAYHRQRAGGG